MSSVASAGSWRTGTEETEPGPFGNAVRWTDGSHTLKLPNRVQRIWCPTRIGSGICSGSGSGALGRGPPSAARHRPPAPRLAQVAAEQAQLCSGHGGRAAAGGHQAVAARCHHSLTRLAALGSSFHSGCCASASGQACTELAFQLAVRAAPCHAQRSGRQAGRQAVQTQWAEQRGRPQTPPEWRQRQRVADSHMTEPLRLLRPGHRKTQQTHGQMQRRVTARAQQPRPPAQSEL